MALALAGPANRQGRLAADNMVGWSMPIKESKARLSSKYTILWLLQPVKMNGCCSKKDAHTAKIIS